MTKGNPDDQPIETEDIDHHGKLMAFNPTYLSGLSLAKTCAWITLAFCSDELGRAKTPAGTYPRIPALSEPKARRAIAGLIADGLLLCWEHGSFTCWEVRHAQAYKPELSKRLREQRRAAVQKIRDAGARQQRLKDKKDGVSNVHEDDGKGVSNDGELIPRVETARGDRINPDSMLFFHSKVPDPPNRPRKETLKDHPDTANGYILRMLPSFNPGEDLGELEVVLRFLLFTSCDDYGRVRVDVDRLHQQLGPAITKRVSKSDIEAALERMEQEGHLIVFRKPPKGTFAYLRDSAQHLKKKKNYDLAIPRLYGDRQFTHNTAVYLAFFEACQERSGTRERIPTGSFCRDGNVVSIEKHVGVAAREFLEEHARLMETEPYCELNHRQLIGIDESGLSSFKEPGAIHLFWHLASTNASAVWLKELYLTHQDEFDGDHGVRPNTHKILSHLLRMTPAEFVKQAKADKDRPPVVPDH